MLRLVTNFQLYPLLFYLYLIYVFKSFGDSIQGFDVSLYAANTVSVTRSFTYSLLSFLQYFFTSLLRFWWLCCASCFFTCVFAFLTFSLLSFSLQLHLLFNLTFNLFLWLFFCIEPLYMIRIPWYVSASHSLYMSRLSIASLRYINSITVFLFLRQLNFNIQSFRLNDFFNK